MPLPTRRDERTCRDVSPEGSYRLVGPSIAEQLSLSSLYQRAAYLHAKEEMIGAILHLDEPVPPVKLPGLFCSGMHLNSHSADDFGNLNCLFYRMREKSFS